MKIAIDAGHGYNTPGKRSCPFVSSVTHKYGDKVIIVKKGEVLREHIANVGVAYFLSKELERCGFEIFKSAWNDFDGTNDNDISIVNRQAAIRKAKCDYSISCHFNAFGDTKKFNSGQGCETLYHTVASKVGDGKDMARVIQMELCKAFPDQKNRDIVGGSGWGMCNSVGMGVKAAVIVECAFMTNQYEAENYFANPYAWYKYAVQIAKGLCGYTKVRYIPYVPIASIKPNSSTVDILWLQDKINEKLSGVKSFVPLTIDGVYGTKTAAAVLLLWKQMGWKIGNKKGYETGKNTIIVLTA